MKSTFYLKFIVLYIIFGFLSVFTAATLTDELIMNGSGKKIFPVLYSRELMLAIIICLPIFQKTLPSGQSSHSSYAMRMYLEFCSLVCSQDGSLHCLCQIREVRMPPRTIENFDPAEIGSSQYITGDYHGLF